MIITKVHHEQHNRNSNSYKNRNEIYPWVLSKEGILFIFVSRHDAQYPFNLTLLENKAVDKRVIVGIKAYEEQLNLQLQVHVLLIQNLSLSLSLCLSLSLSLSLSL